MDHARVLLDTGPLGRLVHPHANQEIARWLKAAASRGAIVLIPEIADYELRRELLLNGFTRSLERLDDFEQTLGYVRLTTKTMRRAAELWADARQAGRPTADEKALDADVILAAQAEATGSAVVTDNPGHLARYVPTVDWRSA